MSRLEFYDLFAEISLERLLEGLESAVTAKTEWKKYASHKGYLSELLTRKLLKSASLNQESMGVFGDRF